MAQVAQHPPGLTPSSWHLDDKETQDLSMNKSIKKMKNHPNTMELQKESAEAPDGKVPEYDMTEPDDPDPHVEAGVVDPELVQAFKEKTHTSGPVLVMPGVADLPSLEDINAQFLNHHAYYDITIPSQQKPSLAMKNCPHPTAFRRHNRNQHGFTIHCANCNCRLLFAKKYETTKTVTGIAFQKQFAVKSLQQLMDQNSSQIALQLGLLQRAIQTEHLVCTASRPAHGLSQEFLIKQINNLALTMIQQMQEVVGGLAVTMTQQMQFQQDRTLEVMQNGQRDMVVKMNKLNIDNLQTIMAINHENQASLLAAVKPGSCQMHNVVQ